MNNKVTIIGRLGNTIELKEINQIKVANFSLATNESYKDKVGNKVEKTVWHNFTAWGKTAEILAQHTQKGSLLAVDGKLTYSNYKKKCGNEEITITNTSIEVKEFMFLSSKQRQEQ